MPRWMLRPVECGPELRQVEGLLEREGLNTVCVGAKCPNRGECYSAGTATFMILGARCTRDCAFCAVPTGGVEPPEPGEAEAVARAAAGMGLKHVVVTSVTRDDLPDGGAWLYAETVRAIHALNPGTGVEVLIPDFDGQPTRLAEVFDARPEVLAHNIETVPRIFRRVRPAFRYDRSLDVLRAARAAGLVTKSNLILGMGEGRAEVSQAMADLHEAGCDLLTITQYLRPSARHHPVVRWVPPVEFAELAEEAEELGFLGVLSGPLVRSSYRAGRLYRQAVESRFGAATS